LPGDDDTDEMNEKGQLDESFPKVLAAALKSSRTPSTWTAAPQKWARGGRTAVPQTPGYVVVAPSLSPAFLSFVIRLYVPTAAPADELAARRADDERLPLLPKDDSSTAPSPPKVKAVPTAVEVSHSHGPVPELYMYSPELHIDVPEIAGDVDYEASQLGSTSHIESTSRLDSTDSTWESDASSRLDSTSKLESTNLWNQWRDTVHLFRSPFALHLLCIHTPATLQWRPGVSIGPYLMAV
jgi:hypothetical protein